MPTPTLTQVAARRGRITLAEQAVIDHKNAAIAEFAQIIASNCWNSRIVATLSSRKVLVERNRGLFAALAAIYGRSSWNYEHDVDSATKKVDAETENDTFTSAAWIAAVAHELRDAWCQ